MARWDPRTEEQSVALAVGLADVDHLGSFVAGTPGSEHTSRCYHIAEAVAAAVHSSRDDLADCSHHRRRTDIAVGRAETHPAEEDRMNPVCVVDRSLDLAEDNPVVDRSLAVGIVGRNLVVAGNPVGGHNHLAEDIADHSHPGRRRSRRDQTLWLR